MCGYSCATAARLRMRAFNAISLGLPGHFEQLRILELEQRLLARPRDRAAGGVADRLRGRGAAPDSVARRGRADTRRRAPPRARRRAAPTPKAQARAGGLRARKLGQRDRGPRAVLRAGGRARDGAGGGSDADRRGRLGDRRRRALSRAATAWQRLDVGQLLEAQRLDFGGSARGGRRRVPPLRAPRAGARPCRRRESARAPRIR